MKNTINLFILVVLAVSIAGCKVIIPNYTTVEGLSSLKPGMDKTEVLSTLQNVYPHDIYNGEGIGCEVHEYSYKHLYQRVDYRDQPLREGLRGNPQNGLEETKHTWFTKTESLLRCILTKRTTWQHSSFLLKKLV